MFYFLIALYLITNTASRILVRVFTKQTKLNPYIASFALTLPTYCVMLVYSLLTHGNVLQELSIPLFALLGLHAGFLTYFGKQSVVAQKHVETASFMILRQIFLPVSVLLSTIFLGESLSLIQIMGMLLLLAGTYTIASNGRSIPLKHIGKYELIIILYGCFLGLSIVFSRYVQEQASLGLLLIVSGGLESILGGGMAFKHSKKVARVNRKELTLIALIGILSAVHIVSFFVATELVDNVAVVSTISSFRIVTIFMASYLFLHERNNVKVKLIGSALATLGVLLV